MKTLIIANWKLYLDNQKTLSLAENLVQTGFEVPDNVEVVLCPNHLMIGSLHKLDHERIKLGAQDMFWENEGAFTGEIAPQDLRDLGCQYVILGHSERREYLGETNEMINKKVKAAIAADLIPVLCVGEKLEIKKSGLTEEKIKKQIMDCLAGVDIPGTGHLVVAYEPIWAIYPSKLEVDPQEIEKITQLIEEELIKLLGEKAYQGKCQIIYGGSVDSENIDKFIGLSRINGALVGHASTELNEFVKLVQLSSIDNID